MENKMATYAKLVNGQLITTCVSDDEPELIDMIRADGFKPYDEDAGVPDVGEFQSLCPVYRETDDAILLYWEIVDDSPEKIKDEIARLTEELTSTDYRVVKSYEYAFAGEDPPYDVATLHTERQALRDQIGELEQRL